MKLVYEALTAEHEFRAFSCGNSDIDNYFKNEAYADQCRGISSTTVVKQNDLIVGVFSTRCTQIEIKDKEKLASGIYYDRYWPAIEVTYLAVDLNYQKQGIGKKIVKRVTLQAVFNTKWLGAKYLFLWSVPKSIDFYEKLGFEKTDIAGQGDKYPMRFLLPEYEKVFKQ